MQLPQGIIPHANPPAFSDTGLDAIFALSSEGLMHIPAEKKGQRFPEAEAIEKRCDKLPPRCQKRMQTFQDPGEAGGAVESAEIRNRTVEQ